MYHINNVSSIKDVYRVYVLGSIQSLFLLLHRDHMYLKPDILSCDRFYILTDRKKIRNPNLNEITTVDVQGHVVRCVKKLATI